MIIGSAPSRPENTGVLRAATSLACLVRLSMNRSDLGGQDSHVAPGMSGIRKRREC